MGLHVIQRFVSDELIILKVKLDCIFNDGMLNSALVMDDWVSLKDLLPFPVSRPRFGR
jgi:hypothetical protein